MVTNYYFHGVSQNYDYLNCHLKIKLSAINNSIKKYHKHIGFM